MVYDDYVVTPGLCLTVFLHLNISGSIKVESWCFLCELQYHIQRAIDSANPFAPMNILSHLPNIGGNLGIGRQEDAHEFMR